MTDFYYYESGLSTLFSSSYFRSSSYLFYCFYTIAALLAASFLSSLLFFSRSVLGWLGLLQTEFSLSVWQRRCSMEDSISSAMMQLRSVKQSLSSRNRWQYARFYRLPARPISCTQFSMLFGMFICITHSRSEKSSPIPSATVATTILISPSRNLLSVSVFSLLVSAEWQMATRKEVELVMQFSTSPMIFRVLAQISIPLHFTICQWLRQRMRDSHLDMPRSRLIVTQRFLFRQRVERISQFMFSFAWMDVTVSGLAVAVSPRMVGVPCLYLIRFWTMSPSARKEVLKLWLSSERECASSMQVKFTAGKSCRWQMKSVCRHSGVRNSRLILPSCTIFTILSFWSRFSSELMQAAGRESGRWESWSNIRDTRGLITRDRPPISIELIMQVNDFPEAVSDMKTVDLALRIFWMVQYCPSRKDQNPKAL